MLIVIFVILIELIVVRNKAPMRAETILLNMHANSSICNIDNKLIVIRNKAHLRAVDERSDCHSLLIYNTY